MKRIGLLGCGAIATQIAAAIDSGTIPARLTQIYDSDAARAESLASGLKNRPEITANHHLLSSGDVDLIVEAASQQAVRDAALSILQNRRDLMIMSVGALLDESVLQVLTDACAEYGTTVYLPSGAIAGIDGIRAASDELDSVELVTTKPPRSLRGAVDNIDDITEARTVFEGTATQAVSKFPANINVAAILSIAGIGGDRTRVRIVADPKVQRNTHKIVASGAFGRITVSLENVQDPANPKTSRLASLSAIATLRRICSGRVMIG